MKPIKCKNGHYYDAEKYTVCPHCNAVGEKNESTENDEYEKRRSFSFFKREGTSQKRKTGSSGTVDLANSFKNPQEVVDQDDSEGFVEWDVSGTERIEHIDSDSEKKDLTEEKPLREQPQKIEELYTGQSNVSQSSSLQEAIQATRSADVSQDTKTIGLFSVGTDTDPVVGWLVCVKGQYVGESFNLKSGRNNIGRALNMDVPLPKEPSVSRDRHAVITFEPYKKSFILQSGESNGLTYLNGELVVTYNTLKNFDSIQLGQAEFKFMAFCGNEFSWDEYIGKREI